MQQVGYKLIKVDDNSVIKEWGGTWDQCPIIPELIICDNNISVCAPQVNIDYNGYMLIPWIMDQPNPTIQNIINERTNRLAEGFDYNFNDDRGVHRIGTTDEDMKGWDEVTTWANAEIALDSNDSITILTNTGPATITALDWMKILKAASAFRQPIWQASFVLQAMDPIPTDFKDDKWWIV